MNKLLALDTSTDACSVALICDGELFEKVTLEPRAHARLCLPMVNDLLAQTGVSLKELDAIAFGRGPGSFTGVRIAAGIVQGLAFSLKLPVIPVSTLEAMAFQFALELFELELPDQKSEERSQQVVSLLDARMNEVYAAAYEISFSENHPVLSQCSAEAVLAPENVPVPSIPFSMIGSGLVYLDRLSGVTSALVLKQDLWPQASAVAQLGIRYLSEGQIVNPEQVQPVYLRNEVSWKKLPGR